MTASEIYDIVKDVPKEAWPEGLRYDKAETTSVELWIIDQPDFYHDEADEDGDEWKRGAVALDDRMNELESPLPLAAVELLFIGSMTRWMAIKLMGSAGMPSLVVNAPEDREDIWRVYPSGEPAIGTGPTLLHALASATRAVGRGE